jgi:hypothetical protein
MVGAKGPTAWTDYLPYGGPIVGTDAADFNVLLKQVQGKQFLQAYETLKGGGQITEVEGAKAEAAIARMNDAQSEPAFLESLKEFKEIIRGGVERAQRGAGVSGVPSSNGEWEPL